MSASAPKVFLSYRRDDTAFETAAIHRELVAHFGPNQIFMDVDTIPAGHDFRQVLRNAVTSCDVMVAVIGSKWVSAVDASGQQRIMQDGDYIRLEVGAALERDIPVIPLLIGKTPLPELNQLPPDLANLRYRHAMEIRPGRDFDSDLRRLVTEIQRVGQEQEPAPQRNRAEVAVLAEVLPSPDLTMALSTRLIISLAVACVVMAILRAIGEGVYDFALARVVPDVTWPTKTTGPMILCGLVSGAVFASVAWLMALVANREWWRIGLASAVGILLFAVTGWLVYDKVVAWIFASTDPPRLFGTSAGVAFGLGMALYLFSERHLPVPAILAVSGLAIAAVYYVLAGLCAPEDQAVTKLLPLDTALNTLEGLSAILILALFRRPLLQAGR